MLRETGVVTFWRGRRSPQRTWGGWAGRSAPRMGVRDGGYFELARFLKPQASVRWLPESRRVGESRLGEEHA